MAYNSYFPIGYQLPMYQPQATQAAQPQQPGLIWVQGEAGAKSYLVAPNNTVQLWDSESQTIYLKSADASGMPSMRILDYKIRDAAERAVMPLKGDERYATHKDLEALEKRLVDRFTQTTGGDSK